MFLPKFLKTKYLLPTIFALLAIATPFFVFARGLVPCGGQDEGPCNLCFLFLLLQNVMNFMVNTVGIVATLFLIIGGIIIVASGTNKTLYEKGKNVVTNTIVGTIIVLGAWVVINTILIISGFAKVNLDLADTGEWFELQCSTASTIGWEAANPPPENTVPIEPLPPGEVPSGCTPCDLVTKFRNNWTRDDCESAIQTASRTQNADIALLRAIMWKESKSNINAVSPAGSCGPMQMQPGTAGKSCQQLKSAESVGWAAIYINSLKAEIERKDLTTKYNKSLIELIASAYNGGPGANYESRDCGPGKPCGMNDRVVPRWFCPFDFKKSTATCVAQVWPKGYTETRDYVSKVKGAYDTYNTKACLNNPNP